MDNFVYLNISLSIFLFCNKPSKKLWLTEAYSCNFPFLPYMSPSPSSPIWASALLGGTPLPYPSIHTLWMTPTSEKFRQAHELQNMKSLYYQRQCNHKYPYKNNSRFVLSTFKVISRQILKLIWWNFLFFLKVQKQVR